MRVGLCLAFSAVVVVAGGCARPSDEEVLRRTFAIPQAAKLLSLEATPKRADRPGREGLRIDAVFGFGPDELAAYRVRLEKDPSWRPLPPVEEVLRRLPASGPLPLDAKSGVWTCRTAGNDLMHARKSDCMNRPGNLADFMLAVLDADRRVLRVRVKTTY